MEAIFYNYINVYFVSQVESDRQLLILGQERETVPATDSLHRIAASRNVYPSFPPDVVSNATRLADQMLAGRLVVSQLVGRDQRKNPDPDTTVFFNNVAQPGVESPFSPIDPKAKHVLFITTSVDAHLLIARKARSYFGRAQQGSTTHLGFEVYDCSHLLASLEPELVAWQYSMSGENFLSDFSYFSFRSTCLSRLLCSLSVSEIT